HLNYHYLKFLCPEIGRLINGMEVTECFSQNKNELVLGFSGNGRQQFIRSNLAPANTCISFPGEFKRSKKNNVSLFREIIQEKVSHVQVLDFERGFTIHFSSGQILLFKLHGTRSNILLYPEENALPVGMFRHELKDDATIT